MLIPASSMLPHLFSYLREGACHLAACPPHIHYNSIAMLPFIYISTTDNFSESSYIFFPFQVDLLMCKVSTASMINLVECFTANI